ncbi:hypothetical protein V6N13_053506 [Hibiscus sabdariffa]|uniref:DUF4283 domain-containing protein n=1 Tax=Hibiscus sabdariffa TaxID=183260 RepID=A0ABR2T7Z9_9ROSI
MASQSLFNQFQDLDFTNEEQGAIFTPTIQWESLNEESHLIIIGKLISSNSIDDNAMVRAFQDIRNDILSRGPWTFKGDWLALAALNPTYSIDDYTFSSMNIWICIYGIPSILLDDDDTANHTGNSLGNMIGKVVKVDTCRIDLNMVEYLRIGIILDVTKPVRRCVAIGGSGSSPKLCPLQYERLLTLCHGCELIGHALAHCAMFKPTTNTKLQYGDWLHYIPPKKQELQTRSKGSIRYMEGINNTKPKANLTGTYSSQALPTKTNTLLKLVAAAANIIDLVTPKAATGPIGTLVSTDTMLVVATDSKVDNTLVKDTKLAAATAPNGSNISTANVTLRAATGPLKGDASDPILPPTSPVDVNISIPMVAVGESHSIEPFGSTMVPTPTSFGGPEGFIDFMANSTENPSEVPYLLDNVGLDADPKNIVPIPREGGIDYELGKSFLATSSMLVMYDDWLFNKRSMHTATIEE